MKNECVRIRTTTAAASAKGGNGQKGASSEAKAPAAEAFCSFGKRLQKMELEGGA